MTDSQRPSGARARRIACTLLASSILAGCTPPPPQPNVALSQANSYAAAYPMELRRFYAQVPLQGPRNAALNHMRAGLAAMDAGQLDMAAHSFDEVLKTIETIYADNPEAEKARSVWYQEAVKDFKGEPYERAMAYYYRGLIYMMQGDYQNARASFRGGLLQDTYMEDNQRMKATFGALSFLEGWAGRCAKLDQNTVQTSFREAGERNPALSEPDAKNNLLVLFESGSAPQKITAGGHNELLRYAKGALPPLDQASMDYAGQQEQAVQAEDINFQAATREGRMVDAINAGKVQYQDGTRAAGQIATAAGAGMVSASAFSGNRNVGYAGLGLMMVGLIAEAAASSMQTQADARQWDNLPGNIMLASFAWPPAAPKPRPGQRPAPGAAAAEAPAEVVVNFARAGASDQRTLAIHPAGDCALAWGREIPANRIPDAAPNSVVARK